MDRINRRFVVLDQKVDRRFDAVDHRFQALDKKIDTRIWSVVGIQVATLLAIVGALWR